MTARGKAVGGTASTPDYRQTAPEQTVFISN